MSVLMELLFLYQLVVLWYFAFLNLFYPTFRTPLPWP